MRDRGLIHFNHLPLLSAWAQERGWKEEPVKDLYEVLRLRNGKQCAIFHKKHAAHEHVTVWGDSEKLGRQFIRWLAEQPVQQEAVS